MNLGSRWPKGFNAGPHRAQDIQQKLFESLNKTLRPCRAIESGQCARSEMWQRQLQSIGEKNQRRPERKL